MKTICRGFFAFVLITAFVFFTGTSSIFAQQVAPAPTPVEIKIDPAKFDLFVG
ncbi:MAG: hypothetical protein ABR535_10120 [Pyrinomonadaceae bacterium]